MTIPNFLSLTRILLSPLLVWFLFKSRFGEALVVFSVAGATDALDGFSARLLHQKSKLGTYLDPLADKLLLVSSFVMLGCMGILPKWLMMLIVSRDTIILLGIIGLIHQQIKMEICPSLLGKLSTFLQILTVFASLGGQLVAVPGEIKQGLYFATAFFCVASGLQYIHRGIYLWRGHKACG